MSRLRRLIKTISYKFEQGLEPIGLCLLLGSFGWQCFEDHSNNAVYEDYVYHIYEKLDAIWNISYEEYLHSDYYQNECMKRGKSMSLIWVNHDHASKEIFKDWSATKEELHCIESQKKFGKKCRIVLYALGSIMIIGSKCRRLSN